MYCPFPPWHEFTLLSPHSPERSLWAFALTGADDRQIDVEEKGSLDKAAVIAALGQSGDADYDSVCPLHLNLPYLRGNYEDVE
jgi:hypothetical protein